MKLLRIYVSAGEVAAVVAWLLVVIFRVVALVLGVEHGRKCVEADCNSGS